MIDEVPVLLPVVIANGNQKLFSCWPVKEMRHCQHALETMRDIVATTNGVHHRH
jgi:hypothetical protein